MDIRILVAAQKEFKTRLGVHIVPASLSRCKAPDSSVNMISVGDEDADTARALYRDLVFKTFVYIYMHYVFTSLWPTKNDIGEYLAGFAQTGIIPDTAESIRTLTYDILVQSLCNNGEAFTYVDIDEKGNIVRETAVVLRQVIDENLKDYRYRLTQSALNYLYRTLEINNYARDFDVSAELLRALAEHGNYSQGQDKAQQMLQTIAVARAEISSLRDTHQTMPLDEYVAAVDNLKDNVKRIFENRDLAETMSAMEMRGNEMVEAEHDAKDAEEFKKAMLEFRALRALVREVVRKKDDLNYEYTKMYETMQRTIKAVVLTPLENRIVSPSLVLRDYARGWIDIGGFITGLGLPLVLPKARQLWSPISPFLDLLKMRTITGAEDDGLVLDDLIPVETPEDYWEPRLASLRDSFCNYAETHDVFLASSWIESLDEHQAFNFMENHQLPTLLSSLWTEGRPIEIDQFAYEYAPPAELMQKPSTWLSQRLAGKRDKILCLVLDEDAAKAFTFYSEDGTPCFVTMSEYVIAAE